MRDGRPLMTVDFTGMLDSLMLAARLVGLACSLAALGVVLMLWRGR